MLSNPQGWNGELGQVETRLYVASGINCGLYVRKDVEGEKERGKRVPLRLRTTRSSVENVGRCLNGFIPTQALISASTQLVRTAFQINVSWLNACSLARDASCTVVGSQQRATGLRFTNCPCGILGRLSCLRTPQPADDTAAHFSREDRKPRALGCGVSVSGGVARGYHFSRCALGHWGSCGDLCASATYQSRFAQKCNQAAGVPTLAAAHLPNRCGRFTTVGRYGSGLSAASAYGGEWRTMSPLSVSLRMVGEMRLAWLGCSVTPRLGGSGLSFSNRRGVSVLSGAPFALIGYDFVQRGSQAKWVPGYKAWLCSPVPRNRRWEALHVMPVQPKASAKSLKASRSPAVPSVNDPTKTSLSPMTPHTPSACTRSGVTVNDPVNDPAESSSAGTHSDSLPTRDATATRPENLCNAGILPPSGLLPASLTASPSASGTQGQTLGREK